MRTPRLRGSDRTILSRSGLIAATVSAVLFGSAPALAETSYVLTLKDHAFTEQTLHVPADTAFTLTVVNTDATVEEFESHDLHVEKLVPGGKTVTVRIGPLKPGTYGFVGEFHEETAKGQLIAGDAK